MLLLISCGKRDYVGISGRLENGDSIVSIWVKDSVYTFPLDKDNFFAGRIDLKKSAYASILPNMQDIYLSPGEDLEIYANVLNMSGSLNFHGTLGAINNYLKEQEMVVFFKPDYYALEEEEFISKMQGVMAEKVLMLEAKNFNKDFTELEKQRIRYSVGERVMMYPVSHKQYAGKTDYQPGKAFKEFLGTFSLDNEKLFVTRNYRKFLLNYVYFQGGESGFSDKNYSEGIADYILINFEDRDIRNFLLSEVVFRYIWENNGIEGADYLLDVFRRECTDSKKAAYVGEVVKHWERLLPGREAPVFQAEGIDGQKICLEDFQGKYLYIGVWATWCAPCKKELGYLADLEKEYKGRNIVFLTLSVDGDAHLQTWKKLIREKKYGGLPARVGENTVFGQDYMIISVPRFILIGPDQRIIDSNAPRPSGQLKSYFDVLF